MMNFKNEEAVSPVIGVILMVAITVILAAVIAAFVFGMTGNVQSTKTVAVTAHVNDSQFLIVTFQGGADSASVANLSLMVNGAQNTLTTKQPTIGSSFNSTETISPGNCHAVVVAIFKDGSSQVVLDRNF
ncbi:hypothetical protein DSECCO2_105280 [anaerobic digester metagenome]